MGTPELSAIFMIACILFLVGMISQYWRLDRQQRTIDRQNDTIQRLINREPVTYAETRQTPQKPDRVVYAAWGNQMVNMDEDERQ